MSHSRFSRCFLFITKHTPRPNFPPNNEKPERGLKRQGPLAANCCENGQSSSKPGSAPILFGFDDDAAHNINLTRLAACCTCKHLNAPKLPFVPPHLPSSSVLTCPGLQNHHTSSPPTHTSLLSRSTHPQPALKSVLSLSQPHQLRSSCPPWYGTNDTHGFSYNC